MVERGTADLRSGTVHVGVVARCSRVGCHGASAPRSRLVRVEPPTKT